ncbi:DUF3300 domain-containing protein [Caballeronia sp. LZ029]|uniref:DUF3300 domain-containing protein n=1 Tax=Caballeronia sp. LZ029 TaxID=3038564 RepID=UPI0028563546|nr:DUF3300 domain-containing protein [Caballeronia sp. LZ029]MDR5748327.1 DUF3300 domain-containing protein [Caballeronia sp. LZ029]
MRECFSVIVVIASALCAGGCAVPQTPPESGAQTVAPTPVASGTQTVAQASDAGRAQPLPMESGSLDALVGPIALYPDDLVAIILPASTFPVEVVQADRFLDRRKTEKNLPVNEAWQDPIKALLNYPEVLKTMSTNLDWTVALGEAVVTDQSAVLQAVQRFRRQTQSVGNLKTDDKQTVVVEKEVIKIVPSNPEVIYVPQYNPSTVVISSPTPVYSYWPAPYPVYYYPYAPGAAFATGLIWGAAITAAWNGGHYVSHYEGGNNTININREGNVNRADVKNELSNRAANRSANGTSASQRSTQWRSEKKPGQVSGASTRASAQRVGDAPSRAGARAPTAAQSPRAPSAGNLQGRGGDAFSGYGSAQGARADSARGAASRQSMPGGQGGRNFQGGFSGGARGGFGGGGRGGRR